MKWLTKTLRALYNSVLITAFLSADHLSKSFAAGNEAFFAVQGFSYSFPDVGLFFALPANPALERRPCSMSFLGY